MRMDWQTPLGWNVASDCGVPMELLQGCVDNGSRWPTSHRTWSAGYFWGRNHYWGTQKTASFYIYSGLVFAAPKKKKKQCGTIYTFHWLNAPWTTWMIASNVSWCRGSIWRTSLKRKVKNFSNWGQNIIVFTTCHLKLWKRKWIQEK